MTLDSRMRDSRWRRAPAIRAIVRSSFRWTIEYRGNGSSLGGTTSVRVVARPRYLVDGTVSSRLTRAMPHRCS